MWSPTRWSRVQLLNEIARGDWGLCPATPADLARLAAGVSAGEAPAGLWQELKVGTVDPRWDKFHFW